MPRVSASNGVRPELRALAVLKLGATVTPTEINAHVGTGDYAAKYVSFLNTRYGFNITANKDGRRVVSYTVVAEPANAADLRGAQPKAPKVKAPKAAKVAKVKAPKIQKALADIKARNLENLKKVAASHKKVAKRVREFDDVTEQFGTSGEVGTSFSVERDWDSIDGLDLQKLL